MTRFEGELERIGIVEGSTDLITGERRPEASALHCDFVIPKPNAAEESAAPRCAQSGNLYFMANIGARHRPRFSAETLILNHGIEDSLL
jgi:hypothetical protein